MSLLELRDLLAVDVDDRDVVAQVGEAGGGRESYVAGADDRNFAQGRPIISREIHRPRWSPALPCAS